MRDLEKQFDDKEKQDVWQTVQSMNQAWTKGNPEELENYFHKDIVAITPTDRKRLEGKKACIAAWTAYVNATKINDYKETEPNVQIYGNSAVVTYYYEIDFEINGKPFKANGRDMFVLIKENGKWWAVADQFSSYPKEKAQ